LLAQLGQVDGLRELVAVVALERRLLVALGVERVVLRRKDDEPAGDDDEERDAEESSAFCPTRAWTAIVKVGTMAAITKTRRA